MLRADKIRREEFHIFQNDCSLQIYFYIALYIAMMKLLFVSHIED